MTKEDNGVTMCIDGMLNAYLYHAWEAIDLFPMTRDNGVTLCNDGMFITYACHTWVAKCLLYTSHSKVVTLRYDGELNTFTCLYWAPHPHLSYSIYIVFRACPTLRPKRD